jgi:hypothetical protein
VSWLDENIRFHESLSRIERLKQERNLAIGLALFVAVFPILRHFTNIKSTGIFANSIRTIEAMLFPIFGGKSLSIMWVVILISILFVVINDQLKIKSIESKNNQKRS